MSHALALLPMFPRCLFGVSRNYLEECMVNINKSTVALSVFILIKMIKHSTIYKEDISG